MLNKIEMKKDADPANYLSRLQALKIATTL
jgi:hypothetical protein